MTARSRYPFAAPAVALLACFAPLGQAWSQQVPKLPLVAVDAAQRKAREGNAEAAYIVGTALFHGRGAERNYTEATEAFERAAELGIALAQWHLGDLYAEGTKIPENDAKAFRWYLAAALQGVEAAQYSVGKMYLDGRGTTANAQEAAYWFREAAVQGHPAAQRRLGILYSTGSGVGKDPVTAYEWVILAAAQEDAEAGSTRDAMRETLDAEQIGRAQTNAAAFRARVHYNRAELTRQLDAIKKAAAETPRPASAAQE